MQSRFVFSPFGFPVPYARVLLDAEGTIPGIKEDPLKTVPTLEETVLRARLMYLFRRVLSWNFHFPLIMGPEPRTSSQYWANRNNLETRPCIHRGLRTLLYLLKATSDLPTSFHKCSSSLIKLFSPCPGRVTCIVEIVKIPST